MQPPLNAVSHASSAPTNPAFDDRVEVSLVIPCLNEADTVGACVAEAVRCFKEHGIKGEVIVADNNSTDASAELAAKNGARVVSVTAKGYGYALMGGISAARGKYIIMGDADQSYSFLEIPKFYEQLKAGADLVQGCRLPSGGGVIEEGAMPFSHRWLGNPVLSMLARTFFHTPVHDIYCGLRGFTRELYDSLDQRCTGMEFATEMIIKCSLAKKKIVEVPITLHPDGRKSGHSHLRTFRDGWRTLRFFLLFSPRWLFLIPGSVLIAIGLIGYALALPRVTVFGATLDAHTLLVASMAILVGYQAVVFSICAKTFAITEKMLPMDALTSRFFKIFNLERALILGMAAALFGSALILDAAYQWWQVHFGPLDYAKTMRLVAPGVLMVSLGIQTLFGSFLVSILGMAKK